MENKDSYIWVDDEVKLKDLAKVLTKEKRFAVATEQHTLRSFLGFTALIQISTRNKDYLVDAIALHDIMEILRPVFSNPNICKVFHGADNDLLCLQRDYHIYVVNLFDTLQACNVLSKPQRSLAYLLETYCRVTITTNKVYQLEDWRQRPLPTDMVKHARMDVHYLLYIADCLVDELKKLKINGKSAVYEAKRLSDALCLRLFTKEVEPSPGHSAASSIISRQLTSRNDTRFQDLVRRLCCWRDLMARIHDESVQYVLSDNAIVALAEKVPLTSADICAVISQADLDVEPVNSNSSPEIPSLVVLSHMDDFFYLFQDENDTLDDVFQVLLKKHHGPHGSCPQTPYTKGLVSESNMEAGEIGFTRT